MNFQSKQVKVFLLIFAYFILSLLFITTLVDVFSCEFDACRYLRDDEKSLYYYEDIGSMFSLSGATLRMHWLYSRLYDYSTMLPVFFNALLIIFILKKELFLAPSLMIFSGYPGKDLYVIISLIILFQHLYLNNKQSFLRIGLAILLLLIVRPIFIPVTFSVYLVWLCSSKNLWVTLGLVVTLTGVLSIVSSNLRVAVDISTRDLQASFYFGNQLRELTNGYSLLSVIGKFFVYVAYFVVYPFLEFYRLISSVDHMSFFQLLSIFIFVNIRKWMSNVLKKDLIVFVLISSVFIAGISSFIHTRYILSLILPFFIVKYLLSDTKNKKARW